MSKPDARSMSFTSLRHIPLRSIITEYSKWVNNNLLLSPASAPIKYVRLTWLDYANNPRSRILPFSSYCKLVIFGASPGNRPGVRIAKIVFGYIGGRSAEGFDASGNWLYVIDLESARVWPTEEGVMTVYGWFQEEQIGPELGGRIASVLCPRYILHRAVQ